MKIGGQIPWSAIPICETVKISCLMGKHHARDVLGNHFKDQSFRLVHCLSITLSLRKTNQESINLERKSYLDCSMDTLCTRDEFGRVTYWLQTLRSCDGRIGNLLKKIQCKRSNHRENGKFIFPAADGRINLSGRDQELRTPTLIREHPIRGEGHADFLGESEGSLPSTNSRLTSGCR